MIIMPILYYNCYNLPNFHNSIMIMVIIIMRMMMMILMINTIIHCGQLSSRDRATDQQLGLTTLQSLSSSSLSPSSSLNHFHLPHHHHNICHHVNQFHKPHRCHQQQVNHHDAKKNITNFSNNFFVISAMIASFRFSSSRSMTIGMYFLCKQLQKEKI